MIPACKDCNHLIYKRAEDESKADALAWVFKNDKEMVPYYFNFPPLGDDEVRCKILHTGLCHSDVMTVRQKWGPAHYPVCPGHEVIAEITHVGKNVKDKHVGQIVGYGPCRKSCWTCKTCLKGFDNLCPNIEFPEKLLYGKYFGGYATHIQQPACHAIKVPEGIDISTAAPILCAGVTVFAPIERFVKDKDATVGVIGIGGLGHLAIQYTKALGNKVTGFTTSEQKVEEIKKLGADQVIVVDKEFKSLKDHQNEFDFLINTLPISSTETLAAYIGTLASNG